MQIIFSLLSSGLYIGLPEWPIGWIGWIILLCILLWTIKKGWEPIHLQPVGHWIIFVILLILTPLTSLFVGITFNFQNMAFGNNFLAPPSYHSLMIFSSIPWVLAAGLLGSSQSLILAFFSGLIIAFGDTHHIFTPIITAITAQCFSMVVRQPYRTRFYGFLRHPVGAAFALALIIFPLHFIFGFFYVNDTFPARLDYTLTQSWLPALILNAQLLIAAIFAELIFLLRVRLWIRHVHQVSSPSETSLQFRIFSGTIPLVAGLILVLIIGNWIVAHNAAKKLLHSKMAEISQVASESVPYFMETGQSLILNAASPNLLLVPPDQISQELADRVHSVPFFRQLFLFDSTGSPLGGYPIQQMDQLGLTREEITGIKLALNGVLVQTYTVPPFNGENAAQITFLAAIRSDEETLGILLGRADFTSNPFTQPLVQAMLSVSNSGGEGIILDDTGRILYHPDSSMVMKIYPGYISDHPNFFMDDSNGQRRLVYTQPVRGKPWVVILSVPVEQSEQIAADIAMPLLVMLLILAAFIIFVLSVTLKRITGSLHTMSMEALQISQGNFGHSLQFPGIDEVGQLGRSFEQMRLSLKARLDELNHLLKVSKGVSSSLNIGEAVQPILDGALGSEASSARIILDPEVTANISGSSAVSIGSGYASSQYAYLDPQIFKLMQTHEILNLSNPSRMRLLEFQPGARNPATLIAFALRRDDHYNGALWVAYDQPHVVTEEEMRFLSTLAGEATVASANARLFASAEIGNQRLQAILTSTPDPVLVFDDKNILMLFNPASLQTPGLLLAAIPGATAQNTLASKDILRLILKPPVEQPFSQEITLESGKVFSASISSIKTQGEYVGKICILRDITHYKQSDSAKSDFVSTVSHELRVPLSYLSGYAKMLNMVGEVNKQQSDYIDKILAGLEDMNRLINNLLDLQRMEKGIGLKIEKVSIAQVVNQVITSLQPSARHRQIQILQEGIPSQAPVTIEADSILLSRAILNLVDNAIKFSKMGGKVTIQLQMLPSSIILQVSDNGKGISPLDLPHIFEKYYRIKMSDSIPVSDTLQETRNIRLDRWEISDNKHSLGLGLSIVKSIVEQHQGQVWVDSQLGKGSTFFLELPYSQSKSNQ